MCVMAAGWSNEVTNALLTIWGERNIQNQRYGIVQNKVVYKKVSAPLQEELPSTFSSFFSATYFLRSLAILFVMQPNNSKPKTVLLK